MSEGFKIEIFREKNAADFTLALAEPESRMQTGSAAAACSAAAAALVCRALAEAENGGDGQRLDYLRRNAEKLRAYFVHLIDEDVKARGPMRRALKEGGEREQEAALQTSLAILSELVSMGINLFELILAALEFCRRDDVTLLGQAAELLLGAVRAAMSEKLRVSSASSDETFRFVIRREDELNLQNLMPIYESIIGKRA